MKSVEDQIEMRFIFVGAVISSQCALEELIQQGLKPALICTLDPKLFFRHSDFVNLQPLANRYNIPVFEVDDINDSEVIARLRAIEPDVIFVIGWSQLLKAELLTLPKVGCIGFHPSLLPKNRGRAVLPWTIISGLDESGATLLYLDEGVDSGDIIKQRRFPIAADETAQSLYDKASDALRGMIRELAPLLKAKKSPPAEPQDHSRATYFAKRTPSDGWIDWSRSAREIWTLIRATSKPYPGAFSIYRNQKVIIWEARLRSECSHTGVPGQILTRCPEHITVQCGEGWLDVVTIGDHLGNELPAPRYFTRVQERLGVDIYEFWQQQGRIANG